LEDGENDNDKWITVTGNGKTKKLLNPKPKPKLHNAFAILSQPNAPTYNNVPSLTKQMDGDKNHHPPRPMRAPQAAKKCPALTHQANTMAATQK
jgi:hypothetical protein